MEYDGIWLEIPSGVIKLAGQSPIAMVDWRVLSRNDDWGKLLWWYFFFCGNKGALMMILVGILPWNMALTSIFSQGYHPQIMVVHWYFTKTVVVMSYVVLSMDMHILLRWGSPMVQCDCNPRNGGNICPKWWIYIGSPNRYIHIHIHIYTYTHIHIYTSKINSWHRYIS